MTAKLQKTKRDVYQLLDIRPLFIYFESFPDGTKEQNSINQMFTFRE